MRLPAPETSLKIFIFISIPAAVALLRDTALQGQDFEVFWWAARHLLAGEPVYDLVRDGAMSFKYPPWILPAFLPFALVPLAAAKWIWGAVELLSLAYVVRWLLHRGYLPHIVAGSALAFWGIWAVHCMDGQITLSVLALCLWAFEKRRAGAAVWALSAKVFSGFSLFGLRGLTRKDVLISAGVLAALSLPAVMVSPGHNPVNMVVGWSQAASSGGQLFEGEKIRGRDNQGLPALILRVLKVKAENTRADVIVFLICALGLGGYWHFRANILEEDERWAGWLALAAVVHPLAWFHFYVLAFPLAVMALDQVFRIRDRRMIITGMISFAMVALITRKTMGEAGERFEFFSIKSWGVLLFMDVLVASRALQRSKPVQAGLRLVSSRR